MRIRISLAGTAVAILLLSSAAPAQFGGRTPSFGGVFAPVVGEGAAYEITTAKDNKKMQMEMAITGKEEFEGKMGFWMEYSMSGMPQGMGSSKVLMSLSGEQTVTMRMVTRMGTDVIEMDLNMPMMQNRQKTSPADVRKTAERVGSETITVPAGTYTCEHWRAKDGTGDFWISDKVRPMGLVKMTGKDSSMVLLRQITGATTKLPPPYKKFDMQEMMRQSQQHP
jgi:hypothetical protein